MQLGVYVLGQIPGEWYHACPRSIGVAAGGIQESAIGFGKEPGKGCVQKPT